jgi:hypothetical protein
MQDMQAGRRGVRAVPGEEIRLLEQMLETKTDLLAPGGPGIPLQGRAAVGNELFEIVGHDKPHRSVSG